MGIEDPDEDVAEQHRPITDLDEDDEIPQESEQLFSEADPTDVAEQHRVVPLVDED